MLYIFIDKNHFLSEPPAVVFCESPGASFQDVTFMISLFYSNPSIYIINKTKYYYTIHDAQSINNVSLKIDNVIMKWNDEKIWMSRKGFRDESFFSYRICMQACSICKNIKDINKKGKLFAELKKLFRFRCLMCDIATMRQKILCIMMYMKSIIYVYKIKIYKNYNN